MCIGRFTKLLENAVAFTEHGTITVNVNATVFLFPVTEQAVLVDMAGRRFFFFMIEIWPHEFYFVAGLLIMAGLGLFLFTSADIPGVRSAQMRVMDAPRYA